MELDEIEENLERSDLTVLERARSAAKKPYIYSITRTAGMALPARAPGTRPGRSNRTTVRLLRTRQGRVPAGAWLSRGSRLPTRCQMTRATLIADHPMADNRSQLLALARLPDAHRHQVAQLIKAGKAKTVAAALCLLTGAVKPKRATEGTVSLTRAGGKVVGQLELGAGDFHHHPRDRPSWCDTDRVPKATLTTS